ncbi:hypothetical protein [Jannaschia ovalis]|uniref:Uncharacterized protein n=1 Tax=Jannaschia ovalis TaxID=3038773 RepID=A0ABY8L8E5_9RHOB|nr:hypothetical protein [Jannaschia sp. GRR-S6-38]WGH77635.1 hypothetical protein P8627_11360 [Jannaschia sp. GRR-S6-38]
MIRPGEPDPDRPVGGIVLDASRLGDAPDRLLLVAFPDKPMGETTGRALKPAEDLRNVPVAREIARFDDTEARIVVVDDEGARLRDCLTGRPVRPTPLPKVEGAAPVGCEGRAIEIRTASDGEGRECSARS